jgi:hypothetical protein
MLTALSIGYIKVLVHDGNMIPTQLDSFGMINTQY